MAHIDLRTLKALRKFLIQNSGRIKMRRVSPQNAELRKRLDDSLLAFRVARRGLADEKTAAETVSWLRAVRQAVGVPVDVLARRLGVHKYEIFRLEKAERESRIVLATLRRAADALGCDLVYALTPKEGTLEDLAAREEQDREKMREGVRKLEEERKEKIEESIDWRAEIRRHLRNTFRKHGMRIR